MAIKGKKRTRGGRARVAAPPRPVFVTPKKPLFQRLWFRSMLVIVLVGAVATAGFFFWQERRAAAEQEAAREDVARLGVAIETALLGTVQLAGQNPVVLPEAGQALIEIQSGDARERRIRRQVGEWEEAIQSADDRLAAIETDRAQARQAIARMREGLAQYAALVADIPSALEPEDEQERRDAAVELATRHEQAASTFNSGWLIFVTLMSEVGLDQPAPATDPGQVPPGFDPGQLPPGFDPSQLPPGFDPSQLPEGFDPSQLPEGFDPSQLPEGEEPPPEAEE